MTSPVATDQRNSPDSSQPQRTPSFPVKAIWPLDHTGGPDGYNGLSQAIKRLTIDREQRVVIGLAGSRLAEQEFDVQSVGREVLSNLSKIDNMIFDEGKVLVTGVSGFVGRAVASALVKSDKKVVAAVRYLTCNDCPSPLRSPDVSWLEVGNIGGHTKWLAAFREVTTVVHCAARAHAIREHLADALVAYREVNVAGTLQLAREAAAAGVRRFVFLSSIKVNGESTQIGEAFTEANVFAPQDAYGQSKVEAEQGLLTISRQSKMELVIIRPPLVVGPGVKGNFARMVQLVQLGIPLPLGAVHNKRSLVALDNLVSLVVLCADRFKSPEAANQIFVVADGEDLSTSTLLRKIAQASGCPSRLLSIPTGVLRLGASLLGKRCLSDRLLGNLQVDDTKARTLLGWKSVVTLDEQLSLMFHNKTEYK